MEWGSHFLKLLYIVSHSTNMPPARHRKVLRDNIQGVTKPAIRRLCRRGGVKRISGLIYEETRGVLKVFLENVVRDATTYTEHSRRKTVSTLDVVLALKKQGRTLYGAEGNADPPPNHVRRKKQKNGLDPHDNYQCPANERRYEDETEGCTQFRTVGKNRRRYGYYNAVEQECIPTAQLVKVGNQCFHRGDLSTHCKERRFLYQSQHWNATLQQVNNAPVQDYFQNVLAPEDLDAVNIDHRVTQAGLDQRRAQHWQNIVNANNAAAVVAPVGNEENPIDFDDDDDGGY
jgi:histone H4